MSKKKKKESEAQVKTIKYLDLNEIMSRGALLNMIISPRGPGKTYAMKERSLERYFLFGEQFIYVRRTEEEVDMTKRDLFNDILEKKYNNEYEIRCRGKENKFSIRKVPPKGISEKEKQEFHRENPWEEIGMAISINKAHSVKSISLPKVTTIFYDEFITEHAFARLNPNEVSDFIGLTETVVRDRPPKTVRAFMLSNMGLLANPWFEEYDVSTADFARQEFIMRNDGNVCIWFFLYDGEDEEIASNKFASLIAPKRLTKNMVEGEFKDAGPHLVCKAPQDRKLVFNIGYRTGSEKNDYINFLVYQFDRGFWVTRGKINPSKKEYTFNRYQLSETGFFDPKTISQLFGILDRRNLWFSSQDVRAQFIADLKTSSRK